MSLKLSAAALALVLAGPVMAQTTAAITQSPAESCSASGGADCAAPAPLKLGAGISPLAGSDTESEGAESEGGESD